MCLLSISCVWSWTAATEAMSNSVEDDSDDGDDAGEDVLLPSRAEQQKMSLLKQTQK